MSLENAAFLEPLATVMNTLERTRPMPGTPSAVVGPGPFGLLHVQALRAAGAGPIVVFGRPGDEARLEIARRVGADEARIADRAEANAYVAESTGGVGMGLVIETAGTPEGLQTALDITAGGGTLASLGLVRHTEIDALQVMRKDMTWFGVVAAVRRHWAEAIRLVAAGVLNPSDLITHRLPLAAALDGFTRSRSREAVKVMYRRLMRMGAPEAPKAITISRARTRCCSTLPSRRPTVRISGAVYPFGALTSTRRRPAGNSMIAATPAASVARPRLNVPPTLFGMSWT